MLSAGLIASALLLAADPAPETIRLWGDKVPAAVGDDEKDPPTLTVYRPAPDKANGCAVVVCPGGGYGFLAMGHEGTDIADWLTKRGVTAFVLKYRIAKKTRPGPLQPAPMLDVQRAIRTARAKAKDFGVDPNRVGVWGFSAGGHLASTAATHFDDGKPDASDPVERVSCRPDFAILSYPVISMQPGITHGGSRRNLIGDNPDPKLVELYSNERQVTARTPPTFLFHTTADTAVLPENSILFYEALRKAKVPAELHIYEKGPHGVGLAPKDPVLSTWGQRLEDWLKGRGLLAAKKG